MFDEIREDECFQVLESAKPLESYVCYVCGRSSRFCQSFSAQYSVLGHGPRQGENHELSIDLNSEYRNKHKDATKRVTFGWRGDVSCGAPEATAAARAAGILTWLVSVWYFCAETVWWFFMLGFLEFFSPFQCTCH